MTTKQDFPIISVRGIISNSKNEILLLKRAIQDSFGGNWCLPGGKVDYGFTVIDAIRKEIKEETNLECTSIEFLFYLDSLPTDDNPMHYIVFYFLCGIKGNLVLNEESDGYMWVNSSDVHNYSVVFGNEKGIELFSAQQSGTLNNKLRL